MANIIFDIVIITRISRLALSDIEEWLAIAEKFRLGRFTTAVPSFELLQHSLEGLMIYWKDSSKDEFT